MKKFLLFMSLCFGLFLFSNAQVIELIGKGVLDSDNETLVFSDPSTIDYVVVEAAAIFYPAPLAPTTVRFYETGTSPEEYVVDFNYAEQNFSHLTNSITGSGSWGYYTATFSDVDAGGITLDQMSSLGHVLSFTAYVYRTSGITEMFSTTTADHAFVFSNGSSNPLTYDLTIPPSTVPRDIKVVVPFSDVASNGLRWANVKVTAGSQTVMSEFQTNNSGALLRLESLILTDVPGNITDVKVEIYSPNESLDGKVGDSFIVGAISLTTTINQGCTYTQGYWKTHSKYGPASKPDETWNELQNGPDTEFYLSGMSWIEVFNTPGKGNAYYPLAHQFMAAYLNVQAGTMVPAEVQNAWDVAASIFAANTPDYYKKVKGKSDASKAEIAQLNKLASTLADYNEGTIGPGHCGDNDSYMEKSGSISSNEELTQFNEFMVYPNPIDGIATISFSPKNDGNAQVVMYNSNGQKISTLFDQNVRQDIPVTLQLNGNNYNEGLYLLLLQNESNSETQKLIIKR